MRDPKSLRQEAARAREKAQRLLDYAEAMDAAAAVLEGEVPRRLSRRDGYDRVAKMTSTTVAKHRGPAAPEGIGKELADLLGVGTLEAVGDFFGVAGSTVRTWQQRGSVPKRFRAKHEALKKAAAEKTAE